jgi:hypothetical protein
MEEGKSDKTVGLARRSPSGEAGRIEEVMGSYYMGSKQSLRPERQNGRLFPKTSENRTKWGFYRKPNRLYR